MIEFEPLDRVRNNLIGRQIHRRRLQAGDAVFRHVDHAPSICKVANGLGVVRCIDDGGCFGHQSREILIELHPGDIEVGREKRFKCDQRGELASNDQRRAHLEYLAMDWLKEIVRLDVGGDHCVGLIVDEDCAE